MASKDETKDTRKHVKTESVTMKMRKTEGSAWIKAQAKAFAGWMNAYIGETHPVREATLPSDLDSGVAMIKLLQTLDTQENLLAGRPPSASLSIFKRYQANPKTQIQKLDNWELVLKFLESRNIHLVNQDPHVLADPARNMKALLGLTWKLVLSYALVGSKKSRKENPLQKLDADVGLLQGEEREDEEARRATTVLMGWVNDELRKVNAKDASGKHDLIVTNFTTSFKDGLAICGLLNAQVPNAIDMNKLDSTDVQLTWNTAMIKAENSLRIPQMLDAEMMEMGDIDQQAMIAYVQFFRTRQMEAERDRDRKMAEERRIKEEQERQEELLAAEAEAERERKEQEDKLRLIREERARLEREQEAARGKKEASKREAEEADERARAAKLAAIKAEEAERKKRAESEAEAERLRLQDENKSKDKDWMKLAEEERELRQLPEDKKTKQQLEVETVKRGANGQIFTGFFENPKDGTITKKKIFVFYAPKGGEKGSLYWCDPGRRTEDPEQALPFHLITDIFGGKQSKPLQSSLAEPYPHERCCIVRAANGKSLNIAADSEEALRKWINDMKLMMTMSGSQLLYDYQRYTMEALRQMALGERFLIYEWDSVNTASKREVLLFYSQNGGKKGSLYWCDHDYAEQRLENDHYCLPLHLITDMYGGRQTKLLKAAPAKGVPHGNCCTVMGKNVPGLDLECRSESVLLEWVTNLNHIMTWSGTRLVRNYDRMLKATSPKGSGSSGFGSAGFNQPSAETKEDYSSNSSSSSSSSSSNSSNSSSSHDSSSGSSSSNANGSAASPPSSVAKLTSPPKGPLPDAQTMARILRTLSVGEFFTKYAFETRNKSSQKMVFYQARMSHAKKTDDELQYIDLWELPVSIESAICWADVDLHARVFDANRCIYVLNITDVYLGQQTKAFERRKGATSPIQDDRCLSIQGKARTLDLVASSKEQRDRWVDGIVGLLRKAGKAFNLRVPPPGPFRKQTL